MTVLERNAAVGGNAGSFDLAGLRVDYGSHRLHPACDPVVLQDIRSLLGDDLLDRPRRGRIRLRGRWIHFPLKPVDLALRLPPAFGVGVVGDAVSRRLRRRSYESDESFASVLQAGLGRTICRDFYFPYARKIWGVDPTELSAVQARRRVSAGSLLKMARKILAAVPGLKPPGSGRFFYPRHGYGQISEAYAAAAESAGATIHMRAQVTGVELHAGEPPTVRYSLDGDQRAVRANHVWSTVPITVLARLLNPGPPAALLDAASQLEFRAMILVYLVVERDRFTEYDAHYFPERHMPITRLSEPKNYAAVREPRGLTVLCAELPCSPSDPVWRQSDVELGQLVADGLAAAGIPLRAPIQQVVTRRLPQAYPIYRRGYECHFEALDGWLGDVDGVLSFGRQGLFAHDNTHHALYMAYSAADCLAPDGRFDRARWESYRRVFETHVVED